MAKVGRLVQPPCLIKHGYLRAHWAELHPQFLSISNEEDSPTSLGNPVDGHQHFSHSRGTSCELVPACYLLS